MAAKTNYDFERRERDRAKQAKKEAKAREKADAKPGLAPDQVEPSAESAPNPPSEK